MTGIQRRGRLHGAARLKPEQEGSGVARKFSGERIQGSELLSFPQWSPGRSPGAGLRAKPLDAGDFTMKIAD